MKNQIYAITLLSATAMGAGMLALPFAFKDNYIYGITSLFVVAFVMIATNHFVIKAMYHTKQKHQLSGYAEHYLGKKSKPVFSFLFAISIYGAIVAYLTGIGDILRQLTGISDHYWYAALFFTVMFLVYKGMNLIKRSEFAVSFAVISLLLIVSFYCFGSQQYSASNFMQNSDANLFTMLSISLFAFLNLAALPELNEIFRFDKDYIKKLSRIVVFGSLIPLVVYVIFVTAVLGVKAVSSDIASVALYTLFHNKIGLIADIIAMIAMLGAFISLSFALFEMYRYDYGKSRPVSIWYVFGLSFMFLLLSRMFEFSFSDILNMTASLADTLLGILLVAMAFVYCRKAKELDFQNIILLGLLFLFYFGLFIGFIVYSFII